MATYYTDLHCNVSTENVVSRQNRYSTVTEMLLSSLLTRFSFNILLLSKSYLMQCVCTPRGYTCIFVRMHLQQSTLLYTYRQVEHLYYCNNAPLCAPLCIYSHRQNNCRLYNSSYSNRQKLLNKYRPLSVLVFSVKHIRCKDYL